MFDVTDVLGIIGDAIGSAGRIILDFLLSMGPIELAVVVAAALIWILMTRIR